MTRFPYDQFSKDYLKELLSPLGSVETSRKVGSEVREVDVYFVPSSPPTVEQPRLGLLSRLVETAAVFEPFRNAATYGEIRSCVNKLLDIFADLEREAERNNTRITEAELPHLWILSPTASESLLDGFRARLDEENWLSGIYFCGEYFRTAIVVIHQLPRTEETLWLRILGKGRVQQQAINELQALPKSHPLRSVAIDLLSNLKTTLQLKQNLDQEERDLVMQLSPVYLQQLEEARQQGVQGERRNMIENLLRVRFETLDEELAATIQPIVDLSLQECASLFLQLSNLSREELLARFRQ